jgi:hypothetical protein
MGFLQTLKRIALGEGEEPIPELGRNDTCWCGSGKKYKRCHQDADDRRRASARSSAVGAKGGMF